MTLTVYTRDELRDIIVNHIRARVTGANTAPGSHYFEMATAVATVIHGNQAAAEYIVKQILPTTAERKFLELHAYMRQLERLPAAGAIGKVLARAAGLSTLVSIPLGTVLLHENGTRYVTTAAGLTRTASWGGTRSTAPGTNRHRFVVTPSAIGIAPDDHFALLTVPLVVKAVTPETGTPIAVDLYEPHPTVPADGVELEPIEGAVLAVACETTGAATNLAPGDVLTFETPIDGLQDEVIVLEMTGGGDVETDDELRSRLLDWMAERPGSANRADYRQWTRETPGVRVGDAFVYPAFRGPGTVDVIPFGVSGARITGTAVNEVILAHLQERGSMHDDIRVVQLAQPVEVAVDVTIEPLPGFERDWTGSYTVANASPSEAWTTIELGSAPDAIEIGDRVLIQTSTELPRLFQRTVVGKLSGPHRIVIDEALPEAPTISSAIRPGGPLGQPTIDAIAGLFDSLGPGDTKDASRYPTTGDVHGDGLLRARITDVLMDLEGVQNITITSPAADEHPTTMTRLNLGAFTVQLG